MCSKYACALIVVVLAVLAYQLYEPLPRYLDDLSLEYRIRVHLKPLRRAIGSAVTKLGLFENDLEYRRKTARLLWPREQDSDSLTSLDTKLGNVPVRVYLPRDREYNGPVLLFLHGGGWAVGSVDEHDHVVRVLSERLKIAVVSVEYRLAPEFRYPAALDDAEAVLRALVKEAPQFKVDPTRIAVVGDSAGGNLAAALVMRIQRKGTRPRGGFDLSEPQIKMQILIHPVLQGLNVSTVSYLLNENDAMLSRANMIDFIGQYVLGTDYANETLRSLTERYIVEDCYKLNDLARTRIDAVFMMNEQYVDIRERILTKRDRLFIASLRKEPQSRAKLEPKCSLSNAELRWALRRFEPLLDAEFSPLFAESFDRVPPTYIVSCGSDVLRDDAQLYVERLKDARVLVEHKSYLDKYHMVFFYETLKVVDDLREYLNRNALL